eukprot:TRINITY_DN100494_c0_g1_i1.p1 TRINITY_DN100494_c0_g1~~TRINITY_DN100494_c0_g1_i1.p1  ORF type:complete len:145 (-),score=25.70 TRINITY_DN100494_c0_g1_i1:204-638(-)
MIEGGLYEGAASMLSKFAKQSQAEGRIDTHNKALLGSIVVLLYAGNTENAQKSYLHHTSSDMDFSSSEEASAALSLLHAYSIQDAEAIKASVKENSIFIHIEPSTARLAKKLPAQDPKSLPKISFGIDDQIPSQQDDDEEVDIT